MEISSTQICKDMLDLLGYFKQNIARIAEERRLTSMQVAALYMIEKHGDLPMGKVASVLHCDPSNVTGIVDRLVAHKLVNRQECPQDRRAKTISLTPAGKGVVDEMMEALPGYLGCEKLTTAERSALHSAVQKLTV